MANKLLKKIEISGTIKLRTGLHIGGTNSSMSIGGIDTAVIRNPLTNQPFIPGSSLKGKMRSLLEVSLGEIGGRQGGKIENGPSSLGKAADLFGNAIGDASQKPSRVIVRDSNLLDSEELLKHTEIPYTEGKTEVVIDRITSAANPRQIERVPSGAAFELNIVLNIWEQDNNEIELTKNLFKSLQLVHDDYLGGSGSRGYGHVDFEITKMVEKTTDSYYGKEETAKSILEKYQQQIDKLKD
jgi:CRISPR-associated protein Csm3